MSLRTVNPVVARAVAIAAVFGGIYTSTALAGELAPPGGPVSATMKTLDQVEPRVPIGPLTTPGGADSVYQITKSGSYYLQEDLIGTPGSHGLKIDTSDVTIDLRGFNIRGIGGTLDGIHVSSPVPGAGADRFGIIIHGPGRVFGWGEDGIDASLGYRSRISGIISTNNNGRGFALGGSGTASDLTADSNLGAGIEVGTNSIVHTCIATFCGDAPGIIAGTGAQVSRCDASNCALDGIVVGANSSVTQCTAQNNGGTGINIGEGSAVSNCVVSDCNNGYAGDDNCSIRDCSATDCTVDGFVLARIALVTGSYARNCGQHGFSFIDFARVINCNAFGNDSDGFNADDESYFYACLSSVNGSNGFDIGSKSVILDCAIIVNGGAGILAHSNCLIARNSSTGNNSAGPGSGISIIGIRNRIDSNYLADNGRGIWVIFNGNLIVRNSVTNSSVMSYDVAAGNSFAPVVVDPTGAGPWDNFAH